jgi:site-specific DNA-cytosine methylase
VTVTITDLFCGAGGSSLGAQHAGATVAPPAMRLLVGRVLDALGAS